MNDASSNGKATTLHERFRRTTTVSLVINATPSVVWALLTNATTMTEWNSTIQSIQGSIQQGKKIQLVSTLAPDRTFKLKVKEMVPPQRLVWGDAMGTRTYLLKRMGHQQTHFEMTETIGGVLFPLVARQIPPFDASFEQLAADLKKTAEASA